jgi:hypothetical protein
MSTLELERRKEVEIQYLHKHANQKVVILEPDYMALLKHYRDDPCLVMGENKKTHE